MTLLFAYGLGIPLSAVFCFPLKMDLAGIWFGISIANALLVMAIYILIKAQDWQLLAEKV